MPTFKLPQLQMLKAVPLGALISFNVDLEEHIGIRAARADGSLVVVLLHSKGKEGMEAIAMPRNPGEQAMLNPNTYVLSHSIDWTLETRPNLWDTTYAHQTFAHANSGFILLGDGALGMTVIGNRLDCAYFNLKTWQIEDPNSAGYVSTRHWGISLPGVDGKAEWVFEIPNPT